MPKSFGGVIKEYQSGKLHSGSKKGPKVKSIAQTKAIALSEQKQMAKKSGRKSTVAKKAGHHLHSGNSRMY